jgi:hypothetical protein
MTTAAARKPQQDAAKIAALAAASSSRSMFVGAFHTGWHPTRTRPVRAVA